MPPGTIWGILADDLRCRVVGLDRQLDRLRVVGDNACQISEVTNQENVMAKITPVSTNTDKLLETLLKSLPKARRDAILRSVLTPQQMIKFGEVELKRKGK